MVFQHFNLWAHMNVLGNIIEAPMQVLKISRAEATDRARAYLDKVGLSPRIEKQYPSHRSEEHTSELQSLMRISYAVFCLKKKKKQNTITKHNRPKQQQTNIQRTTNV